MLLNAKKMSFLGILLAFTIILVVMSSILETNTLFLLSLASFLVGGAIRETGLKQGFVFLFAAILLSLIVAPNKLYCLTFSAMGVYIVGISYAFERIAISTNITRKVQALWCVKIVLFNALFLPIVWFLPTLIIATELNLMMKLGMILVAQVFLLIYDYAYRYFQGHLWKKIYRTSRGN